MKAPKTLATPEEVASELEITPQFKDRRLSKNKGINKDITLTTEAPTFDTVWPKEVEDDE